jgi:hypothetical protein
VRSSWRKGARARWRLHLKGSVEGWFRADTIGQFGLRVPAIGVLTWLGWQIIGNTVADTTAPDDPQLALTWRPDNAQALVTLAEHQLSDSEPDVPVEGVVDLARRALESSPLEEGALRLLALCADREGQPDRADALMKLAARRSLRDSKALAWLFNARVHENRPGNALFYADAILRTRVDLRESFANALLTFAHVSTARPALIKVLGGDPPWREWFLGELAAEAPEPSITYAVLSGLASTPNPPRDSELKPYLDHLIGEKQYRLAFLTWWHFLPKDLSSTIPFVFNGDFELPVSGLAFDWAIGSIHGARTSIIETRDEFHGHALQVVFAGTRVRYRHVSKLLVLPPGSYQLNGMFRSDRLVNERGVVWRIFCAGNSNTTLGISDSAVGTSDWRKFGTAFQVPSTGCAAQWLRLELAARFPIEEQVSGAVWYDDLAITWPTAADPGAASGVNH